MGDAGLLRLAGMVVAVILLIAGVAYVTGPAERDGRQTALAPGRQPEGEAEGKGKDDEATPADPAPEGAVCTLASAPRPLEKAIRESSGVAASRTHAGIFWTHEDSGDPLLYAVDAGGRTVGTVRVAGAALEDWEDLARAPCPGGGGDCLFVGDIGDNAAKRASITVYRVPEPDPRAAESAPATALRLRYPDGAHDAEALFVLDGSVYVVTKGESGAVALYRAPADAGGQAELELVREMLPAPVDRHDRITGADASADGKWVALRTLREMFIHPAAGLLGGAGAAPPHVVDVEPLEERQGEGVAFAPDGSLVLTSEGGGGGRPGTLARLRCTLP